jgi:glycosyl transferase family 25
LRIFCVNLDRSKNRWHSIEQQASKLGLEIERFAAVDGSTLDPLPNFPISAGAIGCYLSHRGIWREICENDEPYTLVLEDDALLSDDLPKFLHDNSWIPEDADLIHLGAAYRKCSTYGFSRQAMNRRLFRSVRCVGTEGYIISRQCAGRLLADMNSIDREFDQILFNGGRPDLRTYKLFPALCTQDRLSYPGLIERTEPRPVNSNLYKAKREFLLGASKFLNLFRLRRRLTITFE